jgi:hypothetical protein
MSIRLIETALSEVTITNDYSTLSAYNDQRSVQPYLYPFLIHTSCLLALCVLILSLRCANIQPNSSFHVLTQPKVIYFFPARLEPDSSTDPFFCSLRKSISQFFVF